MHSFRFSILVTALIALVSLCAARTVITVEKCTTRSGDFPVKVYRTTKTVRTTAPYTVTRWKTVTKPVKTVTVVDDSSWVYRTVTFTQLTVTELRTVWIGTSTHTRKFTVTVPSYTATAPITTVTITPTTVLSPIPPGIIGVNQDPDNKAAQTLQKREAVPEPVVTADKRYAKYPSAVTCTKTLLTKTGTSDLWKTTTKTTGTQTVWKPFTVITLTHTVTGKNPKTTVVTTSKYKVAFASSTSTVSTPAIWYQTTTTTTLPTPTYYQACGFRNRSPPPALLEHFWFAAEVGFDEDEPTIYTEGNGSAYDCCVSCWKLPASQGVCSGSIWYHIGAWGPPSCDWQNDPECGIDEEPRNYSACRLILEGKKGVCRRRGYTLDQTSAVAPIVVSNGPNCVRWKYGGVPPT